MNDVDHAENGPFWSHEVDHGQQFLLQIQEYVAVDSLATFVYYYLRFQRGIHHLFMWSFLCDCLNRSCHQFVSFLCERLLGFVTPCFHRAADLFGGPLPNVNSYWDFHLDDDDRDNILLAFKGFLFLVSRQIALLGGLVCLSVVIVGFFTWMSRRTQHRRLCKVKMQRFSRRLRFENTCQFKKFWFLMLVVSNELLPVLAMTGTSELQTTVEANDSSFESHGKTVNLYWMHGQIDPFEIPIFHSHGNLRSLFGKRLGLDHLDGIWNDFLIHPIRPVPDLFPLFAYHYIIEMPNDKGANDALVLFDVLQAEDAELIFRKVFPLASPCSREGFLEQVGLSDLCDSSRDCIIRKADEIWFHDDFNFHYIFAGMRIVVEVPDLGCKKESFPV